MDARFIKEVNHVLERLYLEDPAAGSGRQIRGNKWSEVKWQMNGQLVSLAADGLDDEKRLRELQKSRYGN